MKLISFTVPCYNSQGYMKKCVDSLLTGGDDVEIIIVNDGSKDDTLKIATEYAERYPDIVSVIDKENGGHGSGVNAGLKIATGLYFKVVDSDDWLDGHALQVLISTIKSHCAENNLPDLYITNFVYEHVSDNTYHISSYGNKMPEKKTITWDGVKKFRYSHLLLMHALVFKRESLIESGVELPEHTFYVDNLFAYMPLPFTREIFYIDVNLYRYYIGRCDQSVNVKNLVSRYDQQIRVMQCMVDAYSLAEIKSLPKGLKNYMWHMLEAITMNTLFFTCAADSPERRKALKNFWQHVEQRDKALYKKLRHNSYATSVNYLPWRLRGWLLTKGYNLLCKKVKLG